MQASTWICTNQMHSIKFMSLLPLLVCFSCPRILILLYSSILLPLDPCPCLHSHLPYISLSKHFISLSLLPLVVCFSCPRILIVLYSSMLLPFWSMSMLVLSSPLYLFIQTFHTVVQFSPPLSSMTIKSPTLYEVCSTWRSMTTTWRLYHENLLWLDAKS